MTAATVRMIVSRLELALSSLTALSASWQRS
jgi:hypothetical protein